MSNFTRDEQRRRREMDTGWTHNTPPTRDSLISPPTPVPQVDPHVALGQAVMAIEAAIELHGTRSDALSIQLHEAQRHIHAAFQALPSP